MLSVFTSLLPVFILITTGFGLRKGGLIAEQHWRGVELVSFWVLIPALLITILANAELQLDQAAGFTLTMILTTIAICLIVWMARVPLRNWFDIEGPAYTSIFQTSTRWHGFIALAVAEKLYGEPALALLAIAFAVMVPLINVVNILVLAAYATRQPAPGRMIIQTLGRNPLIWSIIVGLAIRLSGVGLPEVAATTLKLAGDGALGVSLLALGAGLSWRAVQTAGKEVILAGFFKIVLAPAIATCLALAFGVSGMAFVVVVLAASVPTAVNGYVLARAMGGDAELYAASMTAQVVVSFVTLPLYLWVAMSVVG